MTNLPRPATQTDEYLFDIAMSLRQLQDGLARLVATMQPPMDSAETDAASDVVQLREPELAQPARKKK